MDIEKKAGLGFAALAGVGVLTAIGAVVASRRRSSRPAPAGLGGHFSTSVEKLVTHGGETKKKGVIVSWALPPGPVPAASAEGAREGLREICTKAGDSSRLYKLRAETWKTVAKKAGVAPAVIERLGVEGEKRLRTEMSQKKANVALLDLRVNAIAQARGVSPKTARKSMPRALAKLHAQVGAWWHYGTCPGCSEQCSRACYVAKTASGYFGSQRMMWGNVCDVVAGKGLPQVQEDACAAGDLRQKNRPCGKADAITLVASQPGDVTSSDLVVDSKRLDSVYVRVHVSGDFFDRQYAQAWLDHARKAVARYNREYAAWQAGTRRDPPLRVHYWTYTRSWRLQDPKRQGQPDPRMLDVIREFPTLEYQKEYWPAWTQAVDTNGRPLAGQVRRGAKQTFAVLLSADSSTGVPWVKDKRNRIMPVSFVLTESDLTSLRPDGLPVVTDWDKRVPGIVLRDHSLRKRSKAPEGSWESGKGQFWCPMEDPGKSVEEKEHVGGCFNCRLCLPDSAEKVAETMFNRYVSAWPDGESFALMETAKRGEPMNWYEEWQRRGPVFAMAVPSVATNFAKPSRAQRDRIDWWQERRLERLPLVGE